MCCGKRTCRFVKNVFLLCTFIHMHIHVDWISVSKRSSYGESWSKKLLNPQFCFYFSISEMTVQALLSTKLWEDSHPVVYL